MGEGKEEGGLGLEVGSWSKPEDADRVCQDLTQGKRTNTLKRPLALRCSGEEGTELMHNC